MFLRDTNLSEKKAFLVVGFIAVVHIFILSRLAFFPYPELLVYPYLTEAGLTPYKQILDQHFPGMMFFPINLASLGINTPTEIRVLHLATVIATHLLLFVVAKKLFKSNLYALSSNFFYTLWQPFYEGYAFWIDSLMPLLLLPAYYFLIDLKNKKKLFLAGFFLGISVLFKQVVIPLAGGLVVYTYFRKKSISGIAPFLFGLAFPLIILFVWILSLGIWADFFYWTVSFNLTTFSQMGRKYPSIGEFVRLSVIYAPIFVIAVINLLRSYKNVLLVIFLVGSLAFAYARFDYVHFQPSLIFIIILAVLTLKKLNRKYKFLFLGYFLIVTLFLLIPFYKRNTSDRVYFYGEFEQKLAEKVTDYVNGGDTIFAMGTTPHIYQLTKTQPPGDIFVFQFPWFMKVSEDRILSGIKYDMPKVVIRDNNSTVQGINLISNMPKIQAYVNTNYSIIDKIDGVEILIPKDNENSN